MFGYSYMNHEQLRFITWLHYSRDIYYISFTKPNKCTYNIHNSIVYITPTCFDTTVPSSGSSDSNAETRWSDKRLHYFVRYMCI
jgi:hypothetical protein